MTISTMGHKFAVLLSFGLLWSNVLYGLEQKSLFDLREFRIQGVGSRIAVSRSVLEDLLKNVTESPGRELDISLPQVDNDFYNSSRFGEVMVANVVINDHTLAGLSYKMKSKVATTFRAVFVGLPIVSGGQHGTIFLALFTDSDKEVFFPYSTNWKDVIYIDAIEETEDGTVTLHHGDDVMVINSHYNDTCHSNQNQHGGEDFDKISGKGITSTNYPLPFDWGCDVLGDQVDFCDVLKQNSNDLQQVGSNVCTEMTISYQSMRCPTTLKIQEISGFFHNQLPFLSAPIESFEAEWVDREHGGGIIFPCLQVN